MKRIKNWIRTKYLDLLFTWTRKKLERQLDSELQYYSSGLGIQIYQDDTDRKYAEGILTIKNKINAMTGSKNKEDYERVLSQVSDLINLGREETSSQKELRKVLTRLCALPEKNQKEIIKERIEHYTELHKYNEQRALIKRIKQAHKAADQVLEQSLLQEWRDKYGKTRNPRGR